MANLDRFIAKTGRIANSETYSGKLLPIACTTIIFEPSNFADLVNYLVTALKQGAGINVHLDLLEQLSTGVNESTITYVFNDDQEHHLDRCFETTRNGYFPEILVVKNSLWNDPDELGVYSICEAVATVFTYTAMGIDTIVDLRYLADKGEITKAGQVASGKESFSTIFDAAHTLAKSDNSSLMTNMLSLLSSINEVIRKGGHYKNGAITTSYPSWGTLFSDYVDTPVWVHPWVKKSVVINACEKGDILENIITHYNKGSLWIEKQFNKNNEFVTGSKLSVYERLLFNVCREVLLEDKGSCMVLPVNLGQVETPSDLLVAIPHCMRYLINLHKQNYQAMSSIYRDIAEDKQVALGFIGLANMLTNFQVSYAEFTEALEEIVSHLTKILKLSSENTIQRWLGSGKLEDNITPLKYQSVAFNIAFSVVKGVIEASKLAEEYGLVRAWGIAPTASVSFAHKDFNGFTTTPEISPPLGKTVERVSNTGKITYQYPENVETANPDLFKTYCRLANAFQELFNLTGLAHSISFNVWVDIDNRFYYDFVHSDLRALYYRLEVEQGYLNKNIAGESCNCG